MPIVNILCVITIPEVITLVQTTLFSIAAVAKALGDPRNLTVSPTLMQTSIALSRRFCDPNKVES